MKNVDKKSKLSNFEADRMKIALVVSYDTKYRQLKITVINFRPIYEDNQSFPNDTELKSKFMILNMGIHIKFHELSKNEHYFISEVSRG